MLDRQVDLSTLNHHTFVFALPLLLSIRSVPAVNGEYVEELRRRQYDGESLHGYLYNQDRHKQLNNMSNSKAQNVTVRMG